MRTYSWLVLVFLQVMGISLLQAQTTITWNGGGADNNWSTVGNWGGAGIPDATHDILNYNGNTRLTPNNDIVGASVRQINFGGVGTGAFIFSGNAFTLGEAAGPANTIINSTTGVAQTINNDITLGRAQTWGIFSGTVVTFNGNINNNGFNLTLQGQNTFNGVLSGTGGLNTLNSLVTNLNGINTYTGLTTVSSGIVNLSGTIAGNVSVTVGNLAGLGGVVNGNISVTGNGNIYQLNNLNVGGNVVFNGANALYDWVLSTDTATGTGTAGSDWGLMTLTGANNLTFTQGQLDLTLANSQGDPDSGGALWTTTRQWLIADLNTGALDYSGLSIDSASNSWLSGYFFLSNSGNDLLLNWQTVPEPSVSTMMLCGGVYLAMLVRRRK